VKDQPADRRSILDQFIEIMSGLFNTAATGLDELDDVARLWNIRELNDLDRGFGFRSS